MISEGKKRDYIHEGRKRRVRESVGIFQGGREIQTENNILSLSITCIFNTLMYCVQHISIMSLMTALLVIALQVNYMKNVGHAP